MPLLHEFDDRIRYPALLSRQRKEEIREQEVGTSASDRRSVRAARSVRSTTAVPDPRLLKNEGVNCGTPSFEKDAVRRRRKGKME